MLQPVCGVEDLVTQDVDAQQAWKARRIMARKGKAVWMSLCPRGLFLSVPGAQPQQPPARAVWPGAARGRLSGWGQLLVQAWPCHIAQLLQAARYEWGIQFGNFFGVNNHTVKEVGVKHSPLTALIHTAPAGSTSRLYSYSFLFFSHFGNGENLLSLEGKCFYFCYNSRTLYPCLSLA